jgi:hypothetical protein
VSEAWQSDDDSSGFLRKRRDLRLLAWVAAALTLGFSLGWAFARLSAPEALSEAPPPARFFDAGTSKQGAPTPAAAATAASTGAPVPRAAIE